MLTSGQRVLALTVGRQASGRVATSVYFEVTDLTQLGSDPQISCMWVGHLTSRASKWSPGENRLSGMDGWGSWGFELEVWKGGMVVSSGWIKLGWDAMETWGLLCENLLNGFHEYSRQHAATFFFRVPSAAYESVQVLGIFFPESLCSTYQFCYSRLNAFIQLMIWFDQIETTVNHFTVIPTYRWSVPCKSKPVWKSVSIFKLSVE